MGEMSKVSDGYHTFEELYEYRMLYNAHAALGWLAAGVPVVRSRRHHDGEPCFDGTYFIVVATLPKAGQLSNHYKLDYWSLFAGIPEVPVAPEWDGHTPQQAAQRLAEGLAWAQHELGDVKRAAHNFWALEAGGVDNWQGYEIAMEEYGRDETG